LVPGVADGNPFGAGLSGRQSWRRAGARRFGEVCAEAHEHDVNCQSATRLATPAADAPAPNGLPSAKSEPPGSLSGKPAPDGLAAATLCTKRTEIRDPAFWRQA